MNKIQISHVFKERDSNDFSFVLQFIFSWRCAFWIWCRWHFAQIPCKRMKREKHPFGRHRRRLERMPIWIHCNRARMVANNSKHHKCKVERAKRHTHEFKRPNSHRSRSHTTFIRSQQHQRVDISFQLIHKMFLRLRSVQVCHCALLKKLN